MTDPYKTPESDVEVITTISKTRWKVFFWMTLVLEVLSIVLMIIDPDDSMPAMVIELIVYPILIIGLFGFAYDRKIFFRQFWSYKLPIGMAFDLYLYYDLDWAFESMEELYFSIGLIVVIGIPLALFQYLALYKYSFRSPEIWR
jgi:hypothetical protein